MTIHSNFSAVLETKSVDTDPVAEVKTALAGLTADVEAKTAPVAALTSRLDDLEAKFARPALHTDKKEERSDEAKAFASFLRLGAERMQPEEVKALNISTDTAGGYLATPEFTTEIIKNIVEISPIRSIAGVRSTSAQSVLLPKRTGTPTGKWVSETGNREGSESSYGQQEIAIHEAAVFVDVSTQLLEDAAVNVEAEVASDLAEEFARLEGAAFIAGSGTGQPKGVLTNADILRIASGSATGFANPDVLIDAFYNLKSAYRSRSTWVMNSTTLASVRKFKDGNGNYIWQPGLQAGEPSTLLGRPVIEDATMPDIAADATPIAFGDFSRGYRIYDRVVMSILRDPYTQATTGKVRFHARRRVGADVIQPEALRLIEIAS